MKRKYEYPKMEIIEFDTKDVITTSGVSDDDSLNFHGCPLSSVI